MVVNFSVYRISRGTRKLIQTSMLIKKNLIIILKKKKTQNPPILPVLVLFNV
jgi:hypothetical protein